MRSLVLLGSLLLVAGSFAQKPSEPKAERPRILLPMPLGINPGESTKVTLRGLRLDTVTDVRIHDPRSSAKLVGKGRKVGGVSDKLPAPLIGDTEVDVEITLAREIAGRTVPISVIGPGGESTPARLLLNEEQPITNEKEPNDEIKQAQPLTLPAVVAGSIGRGQDVDSFRFEGTAGTTVTIEVIAVELGSPMDGLLTLYDADGKTIAMNDDAPPSLDPRLRVVLPKSGTYVVSLLEAHDQGGPMFVYRLLIRSEK